MITLITKIFAATDSDELCRPPNLSETATKVFRYNRFLNRDRNINGNASIYKCFGSQ